ncbi:MAG: hypothetical protein ACM3X5_03725 [Bacillota bacterium]
MTSPRKRGANAAQLRDAIDRGRTGSKVPYPDPAAAPLGTDDEAAGTPPTPAQSAEALRNEVRNPAAHHVDARPRKSGRDSKARRAP